MELANLVIYISKALKMYSWEVDECVLLKCAQYTKENMIELHLIDNFKICNRQFLQSDVYKVTLYVLNLSEKHDESLHGSLLPGYLGMF